MKRLLSILLSTAIIFTLFSGINAASAETVTYQIGDRPYAENGISQEPVVTSGEGVKFYDDFFVKYNMDALTDSNFTTNMYLESKAQSQSVTSAGVVTSTASLETNSENVYGGTGKSYKLSYEKSITGATPQGDTIQRSYHRVTARTQVGAIAYTEAPDLALAFWIKTAHPVYITVRCMDNDYGLASQFLISKEILIPAGESIVEVPFAHMAVDRAGYVKNKGSATAEMKFVYPDILIRPKNAFGEGETARDIYIDNIGYYLVASNGDKTAEHKINAVSKMGDISGYTQASSATQVQRTVSGTVYKWSSFDGFVSSLSPSGTDDKSANANAYKNAGQSICYTTPKIAYYGTGSYNAFSTTETFYLSDNYAYFWGEKATIAIWVKSSRALKVFAEATDKTDGIEGKYKSSTYIIPAGESILRIPVSDFAFLSGTENANRTWRGVYGFTLRFSAVNSTKVTLSNRATTLYIDALRVECPRIGDSNEDGKINAVDMVRLKKFVVNNDTNADITLYDVGSDNFDDKGFSLSDGAVNITDIVVLREHLLGSSKVSVAPFTNSAIAVSTLSSWGFDS